MFYAAGWGSRRLERPPFLRTNETEDDAAQRTLRRQIDRRAIELEGEHPTRRANASFPGP
jgi:hypothetical protein